MWAFLWSIGCCLVVIRDTLPSVLIKRYNVKPGLLRALWVELCIETACEIETPNLEWVGKYIVFRWQANTAKSNLITFYVKVTRKTNIFTLKSSPLLTTVLFYSTYITVRKRSMWSSHIYYSWMRHWQSNILSIPGRSLWMIWVNSVSI